MKTLIVDIETTGLPEKGHEYKTHYMEYPYIVSIAWKANDCETKEFIINQEGREIPERATQVHGITTEMANASPYFMGSILEEFIALGVHEKVIGHNIYFDSSTIKAQLLRLIRLHKMDETQYIQMEEILHKNRRVDTMKLTTKYCNLPGKYGPKWPKLEELYFKLFGEQPSGKHSSGGDVETTWKCYKKLVELGIIK